MNIPKTKSFITFWLPKDRYIELARYVRNYYDWLAERENLVKSSTMIDTTINRNQDKSIEDLVLKRTELNEKINQVDLAALEASKGDKKIKALIVKCAVCGLIFSNLSPEEKILSEADFKERMRAFYWYLDQQLKS